MLQITKEQVEWFAERDRRDFLGRMAGHIRAHYSHRQPAGVDLDAWLREALDQSLRYGIDTEPEAAQLILLFLVLGIDAPQEKRWVLDTLRDRRLLPIGKVRKLVADARANQIDGVDEIDVTSTQEIT